jgi:hypothetical protein
MTKIVATQTIINHNEIEISFPLEELKPTVESKTVRCIIKHWETDEYLVIKEKKFDGIMSLLTITPFKIHNKFYNKKKGQNQYSIISLAIVELASGENEERSQEEQSLIDIKWVKKAQLLNSVDTNMDKFFIEKSL